MTSITSNANFSVVVFETVSGHHGNPSVYYTKDQSVSQPFSRKKFLFKLSDLTRKWTVQIVHSSVCCFTLLPAARIEKNGGFWPTLAAPSEKAGWSVLLKWAPSLLGAPTGGQIAVLETWGSAIPCLPPSPMAGWLSRGLSSCRSVWLTLWPWTAWVPGCVSTGGGLPSPTATWSPEGPTGLDLTPTMSATLYYSSHLCAYISG